MGYRIFTPYRRGGYATEAVSAMMGWAEKEFGVRRFVASVSPANMPSLKLIAHFGFTKIGEALDETDGLAHIFLRDTDSPA